MRLLFADNARTDCALLVRLIEIAGYSVQSARVETLEQMREALSSAGWDAVLSELDLPGLPHIEALQLLRDTGVETPFLIVTNVCFEDAVAEAMVAGADDYVAKSRLARLVPALERSMAAAAERQRERAERARLRLLQPQLEQISDVNAIARDLHDTLDELMTGLAGDMAWLGVNMAHDAGALRVQNMQLTLDRARERAVRSISALRPQLLEQGIVQALHTMAYRVLHRYGIVCAFAANRAAVPMDEQSFFVMYRVCQEALTVFARHSGIRSVHVELFAEPQSVTLEVADDGRQETGTGGHAAFSGGLFRDLRDATSALGGRLEISSSAGHGTSVILSLPLAQAG